MESINKMLTKQTNVTIGVIRDKNNRPYDIETASVRRSASVAVVYIDIFSARIRHTDI